MKNDKKTTSCSSGNINFNNTTTSSYYYQVFHDLPSADICVNNNRLKYYDDEKCFLNGGDEFQIELTNNSDFRYLVKIKINGKFISTSGLIIEPQSHHYLDRFIDKNKKFKFNTFMVDDVDETKEQRERNGKVEILFYKEIQQWATICPPNITYTGSHTYDPGVYFGGGVNTNSLGGGGGGSWTTNAGTANMENVSNTTCNFSNTSLSQVETGRVDEGSKSNQKFKSSSGNFSSFSDKHQVFHILPISQRPPEEIKKIRTYCEECGLRIRKSSWKFCPKCGHKF